MSERAEKRAATIERKQIERDCQELKVSGHGGRIYSTDENRLCVLLVKSLQRSSDHGQEMTQTEAIDCAAFHLQRSVKNLTELVAKFDAAEENERLEAIKRQPTTRGNAHPTVQSRKYEFTPDRDQIIYDLIDSRARRGKYTASKEILAELLAKTGGKPSHHELYDHMQALSLPFGTVKRAPLSYCGVGTKHRERIFLIEFDRALKAEIRGDTVIVYSDESFLHQFKCHMRSYYNPRSEIGRHILSGGKGKRLIVLHAMTRDGLVQSSIGGKVVHSPDGPIGPNGTPVLTAELIYEGEDFEDYHKTMNADSYEAWIRMQLIPTLKQLYPGKRIVLVVDGASYHRARLTNDAKPHQNKSDLIRELESFGAIDFERKTPLVVARSKALHTIQSKDVRKAAPVGPYVQELRTLVRGYKRALPPMNVSRVSDLFDSWSDEEKRVGAARHKVLYTPPGASELQPIEKLWAKTKNLVADQYFQNRSIKTARTQLIAAFDTCDRGFCTCLVQHAIKEMNLVLKFHSLLSGMIGSLVYDQKKSDQEITEYVNAFIVNPPPKRRRPANDDSGESSSESDEEPDESASVPSAPLPNLALLLPPPLPAPPVLPQVV